MTGKIMFSFCGGISHTLLSPHAWGGQDITKKWNNALQFNHSTNRTQSEVCALFTLRCRLSFFCVSENGNDSQVSASQT